MKQIDCKTKNIRSMLSGTKFAVDFYQREYRWGAEQITELLDDLTEKFLDSHKADNERSAVESYGHYFLGSVIISDKNGQKFIIDGQQRLTSVTLVLTFLYRSITDDEQKGQLSELIFSQKFGKRSFNLDVSERTPCMEALFKGEHVGKSTLGESVDNIISRYNDIESILPERLTSEELPYFADWLIENVHLVEITTYSDDDAYTIFETMNDRGLSLRPTDMLKGYLLANISDPERRTVASAVWRRQITSLQALGKDEDGDAIKAWLRSQHAETIRERKRGAHAGDFDLIGTQFHRWIRDKEESLGLTKSNLFANFIEKDFAFFGSWYLDLREAANELTAGLESVFYNAQNNFTLQYTVLMAGLRRDETYEENLKRIRAVSAYLDILLARRIWNWRATDYSTMQYSMFVTLRELRKQTTEELVCFLTQQLSEEKCDFSSNGRFRLHGTNGKQIHRLLARMTDFVEVQSGRASRYREYIQRSGKNAYEVEHVWADHADRHLDEFSHPSEFSEYRSHIGGLLLLPKSFNASYGDLPYSEKYHHYFGQNILAQSLHERAYEHDPGFRRFLECSRLPFRPHIEFRKADLDERQALYEKIAQQIWDPDRIRREAEK